MPLDSAADLIASLAEPKKTISVVLHRPQIRDVVDISVQVLARILQIYQRKLRNRAAHVNPIELRQDRMQHIKLGVRFFCHSSGEFNRDLTCWRTIRGHQNGSESKTD